MEQDTKLTLSIAEIVYDIQNKTYLTGLSRSETENHRQVAKMQANNDDSNLNQILRSLQSALGNLRQELGEWITDEEEDIDNTSLPDTGSLLEISLSLPGNFNMAMMRPLTDAAHQYLTAFAVAEWFAITNKPDAEQYTRTAREALNSIARTMSSRIRPQRPSHCTRQLPPY